VVAKDSSRRGYTLVYTPHIAHEKIYLRSGHLEKYGEKCTARCCWITARSGFGSSR